MLVGVGTAAAAPPEAWPVCDNRAYRDEEIEPGGLRLLGVKESPLGDFPTMPVVPTHEHFFQQLREVWTDDCPRVMVQLGLQPAAGRLRNWTSAALWLHYFNHSGAVLVVDAVDDYLGHFEDTLRQGPLAALSPAVSVQAVHVAIAPEARGAKGKPRPVSFAAQGGRTVPAADEVMRGCSPSVADPDVKDEGHPCARILRRMASPEPLEYRAPFATFDDVWARSLESRHVDFLQVDVGSAAMADLLRRGFANIFTERQVSVLSFRVDALWTKAELQAVVEWLDKYEYFSLFKLACPGSSQVGTFSYVGPGGTSAGPTTYLPLSGVEFDRVIDWDRIPLPQDVLAFDLRQPDIFRTVQLGDMQCDADEDVEEESCAADGSGTCAATRGGVPAAPSQLRVVRAESRALTIEWRQGEEGGAVDAYDVRVDPGAMEDTLDSDMYDMAGGALTHTIGSLRPDTLYTIRLRAVGRGGESEEAVLSHRTEEEYAAASAGALYEVLESLHCGMSSAEEVSPAGPPPDGASFFRDVADPEGCRARCDDNRQCVAFQVKIDDACWLYRRRPMASRLAGPRGDVGWYCGIRREEV